ncbi:MAG: hypothetical protein AB7R90_06225 [Reyranellaceae bacterium]
MRNEGIAAGAPGADRFVWHHIVFVAAALIWAVLTAVLSPPFGGTDVFHFKDAACNLAAGYGFETASVVFSQSFTREPYASHVPLYPLLFALHAFVFGCGAYANAAFELALGLALASMFYALCVRAIPTSLLRLCFALLCGVAIPFGCLLPTVDRYDVMAMAMVLALLLLRSNAIFAARADLRDWLACGVVFLAQPFLGCIIFGTIVLLQSRILFAIRRPDLAWLATRAVLAWTGFLLPIAIWIVALETTEPGAWKRFYNHGLALIARKDLGFLDALNHAALSAGLATLSNMGRYAITVVLLAPLLPALWRVCQKPLVMALVFLALVPFVFPKQSSYFPAVAFLAVVLCHLTPPASRWQRLLSGLASVALVAMLIPMVLFDLVVRYHATASFVAERTRIAEFARFVERERPGGLILVPGTHFFIAKPVLNRIFDYQYYQPAVHGTRDVAAAVACYTLDSTGGLEPQGYDLTLWPLHPILWQSNPSADFITLLGRRIIARQWVWNCNYYLMPLH